MSPRGRERNADIEHAEATELGPRGVSANLGVYGTSAPRKWSILPDFRVCGPRLRCRCIISCGCRRCTADVQT